MRDADDRRLCKDYAPVEDGGLEQLHCAQDAALLRRRVQRRVTVEVGLDAERHL